MVGLVIMVAALLSGLIDRSDVPQVGVFLSRCPSLDRPDYAC